MEYIKLNELVGKSFVITTNRGFKFKAWDATNNKMLVSDTPQKGFRKIFSVETDEGVLDLSSSQIGAILSECLEAMTADLNNKTIEVKSNGQAGKDIRYFFNVRKQELPEKYSSQY